MGAQGDAGRLAGFAKPYRVVAFDWDGTAVMGRQEDAGEVCRLLDRLMRKGVKVVVITGTNLRNTVTQLAPLVRGGDARNLFIATNRGSEVWGFPSGPEPVSLWARKATSQEEQALTAAADEVRDVLKARAGLETHIVYDRVNRRKIDLIPLPEWADPPKSRIGELLQAVQARLSAAGFHGGLQEILGLAQDAARRHGLRDARVTSDVKHVEIGLTDKADSIEWMAREIIDRGGISLSEVLIAGDEFGPIGGAEGSDFKMVTPLSRGAAFVSVGKEPGGLPDGVVHLGGGPERFRQLLALLAEAHERPEPLAPKPVEEHVELPLALTVDKAWTLSQEGVDLAREHEYESLFAIGNGYAGTRGSIAEGTPSASLPATFLAGVFDTLPSRGAVPELSVAPEWTKLRINIEGHELRLDSGTYFEHRRVLDMRQGASWRVWRHRDPSGRVTRISGLRLASLDDRHLFLQSVAITPENYSGRIRLEAWLEPAHPGGHLPKPRPHLEPDEGWPLPRPEEEPQVLRFIAPGPSIRVAVASQSRLTASGGEHPRKQSERGEGTLVDRWTIKARLGETYRFDRLICFSTSRDLPDPAADARRRIVDATRSGPAEVARRHAQAWRETWEAADVRVEGDEEAQRALRFSAYHLFSAANPDDERVSIGARTLSGESYKGHVFWDTDVFMLPLFAYTAPKAARALLMYRWHTLPGAREKARQLGFRGALFAWESTDTGAETTPKYMLAPDGEVIRILSGDQEHHISADVAWAAWEYWLASGDQEFLSGPGAELLLDTARFWASRGRMGGDGRFHIQEVIGPDEYHEGVDDNAFTNVMAQWNLERGLEVASLVQARWPERWDRLRRRLDLTPGELEEWRRAAEAMFVNVEEGTGLIEQFRGYFALEDYDLGPMRAQGKRAASLDMLLGREKTLRSKIVKQADVVMLLHLLHDRFPKRVCEANFRYYEPRTCHGSSLSPAVHAAVAARIGDLKTAEEYFLQAARIDLANNMGNAAGGVHAAAMGGLWQAAVMGFAGMRARPEGLELDPRLPSGWRRMKVPVRFRGTKLEVSVEPSSVDVRVVGEGRVRVKVGGGWRELEGRGA